MVAKAEKNVTLHIVVFDEGTTTIEVKDNLNGSIEFTSFNAREDSLRSMVLIRVLDGLRTFKWRVTREASSERG